MKKFSLILVLFILVFRITGCSSIFGPDEKTYSVSGEVTDWSVGYPIVDHTVCLVYWPGEETVREYTKTDSLGKYCFSGLQNGHHRVFCREDDLYHCFHPAWIDIEIKGADVTGVDFDYH